jgi:hypothetical protein
MKMAWTELRSTGTDVVRRSNRAVVARSERYRY